MDVKRYRIHLSDGEREELIDLIDTRSPTSKVSRRARMLLRVDESGPRGGASDGVVADECRVSTRTVSNLRKRMYEEGLEVALYGKKRSPKEPVKLTGEVEAHLIALRCQEVPEGRKGWSLRFLADQMVELGYVESISHEGVRQLQKKTNLNPGESSPG